MKRHYLIAFLAMFLLLGTGRVMAQSEAVSSKLVGVWQMCFYVSDKPDVPGDLRPSNCFKILGGDGTFINMNVIPNYGAIIQGLGTFKETAPNAYTEHVEKNLHLPQLVGVDNVLEYEMKGDDVMVLKYFVKTDKEGNELNTWYYETWKRVRMPAKYPSAFVR